MRFSTIATALLAPLSAQAVVMFTNNAYDDIADGVPFNLTWSGDGTPATIDLLTGPTTMLTKAGVVAEAVVGAEYTWTPSGTLQETFYALSITQSGITNYSPQFSISANRPSSSTAAQAAAVGYHHPTYAAINGFNTSSTTSSAHIRYVNTISPDARAATGSSLGLYPTRSSGQPTGSSLGLYPTGPSGQPTASVTLASSIFTGGAMRRGGFGLGCSVAAVLTGAALARWAF